MSLEQAIAALTAAVNANTEAVGRALAAQSAAPLNQSNHAATAMGQVGSTPIQNLGSATASAGVANGMPAAPTFGFPTQQAVAPVQQAPAAPFSTQQELFNYTGSTYQAMGAEKGAKIQGILTGLGIANLNDLKPEQYGTFYAQVEALKAGA